MRLKIFLALLLLILLSSGNTYAGEPYSKYIITLNIWATATIAMLISIGIFGFISDFEIPKSIKNFYYYPLIVIKIIILIVLGIIGAISWFIWIGGMMFYLFNLIGAWVIALVIPFFLLMNWIGHLFNTWLLPKIKKVRITK